MSEQQFNISDSNIAIVTGRPDMIVRHSISDEELDILCSASGTPRDQVVSIAAGALVGSGPAALPAMFGLWVGQAQTGAALLQCSVAIGAGVAIAVILYATKGQKSKAKVLLERIRKRVPPTA